MILVDFHPAPEKAIVDGPQALLLSELPHFLEDVQIALEGYEKRKALAKRIFAENQVVKFCLLDNIIRNSGE